MEMNWGYTTYSHSMFNDLVLAIINDRLDKNQASIDYTFEGPPGEEKFPY